MRRKCLFLFLWFSIFIFAFWMGAWTAWAESHAHYTPEYEKINMVPVLQKESLNEADYELIFAQTGMTRAGVEELREKGRQSDLLLLQERFFAEVEMECLRDNLIVQSERLVEVEYSSGDNENAPITSVRVEEAGVGRRAVKEDFFLPDVQAADILISFSGHVFGWRNGHAAIVVDAEEGLTLEAITLGSESRICNIKKWAEYPCFALLRMEGLSDEERAEIAEYAQENLVGISYRLFSFSGESKVAEVSYLTKGNMVENLQGDELGTQDPLTGTHCAHLVWSAYAHFGYDLDSDGGMIVTPRDIFDSDLLEVVQIYGLHPAVVELEIK